MVQLPTLRTPFAATAGFQPKSSTGPPAFKPGQGTVRFGADATVPPPKNSGQKAEPDSWWKKLLKDTGATFGGTALLWVLAPFAVPILLGMTFGFPLLGKWVGASFNATGQLTNRMGVARAIVNVSQRLFASPFRWLSDKIPLIKRFRYTAWLQRNGWNKVVRPPRRLLGRFFKNEMVKNYVYVPKGFFPKIKHFFSRGIEAIGYIFRNWLAKRFKIFSFIMGWGIFKNVGHPGDKLKQVINGPVPAKATTPPPPPPSPPKPAASGPAVERAPG